GDNIHFQVHRTDANDVTAFIYNCHREEVATIPASFIMYDTASVYYNPDGTEIPLVVHEFNFRFASLGLPDDTYYIYVPVEYFDGVTLVETKPWISEPLAVALNHDDTIYIEYSNYTNKQDVIFTY